MTQRTFEVEHPGTHDPSPAQIAAALRTALHKDGLARDGDYKITSYSYRSGGPSKVTVEVPTKKTKPGDPEPTDDAPEQDTTEPVAGQDAQA